jgi:glycosyltransferase involved in cell wall biosynthesis
MILFSVIVPHHNSEILLKRLLATIPDDSDIEIIIVDDNSDHVPNSSISSASNYVIIKNNTGLKGAGVARNIALTQAKGDWLIFADADDTFTPNAFTILRQYSTSEHDVIYFSPESRHDTKGEISFRHSAYSFLVEEYVRYGSQWIRFRFHSPWSKMIRSSLVHQHKITFDEIMVSNDMNFSLKVGCYADSFFAVKDVIYCISQSYSLGLSNQRSEKNYDIRLQAHIDYNDFLKKNGLKQYRMSMLSVLKKSLNYGIKKFIKTTAFCIVSGQPFFDRYDYIILKLKRSFHLTKI